MNGQVVTSGRKFKDVKSHSLFFNPDPTVALTKSLAPTEDLCPREVAVKVNAKIDYYPKETSYSLINDCLGILLQSMSNDMEWYNMSKFSDLS